MILFSDSEEAGFCLERFWARLSGLAIRMGERLFLRTCLIGAAERDEPALSNTPPRLVIWVLFWASSLLSRTSQSSCLRVEESDLEVLDRGFATENSLDCLYVGEIERLLAERSC